MSETPKNKSGWRTSRYLLASVAILLTLVALFYTEEDLRGKWAWENCQRNLEAQGLVLDWDKLIPPPVPDDQNFYNASTNIALRFRQIPESDTNAIAAVSQLTWLNLNITSNSFLIFKTSERSPLIVANIIISPQPDTYTGQNKNTLALSLNDPATDKRAQGIIAATIGKTIAGAQGFEFSQYSLDKLQPAQIFVQAGTQPSIGDLESLVPSGPIGDHGRLRVVATANPNIFHVQLINLQITSVADYLAWSDQFVPAFDEIREALKRPYAVLPGDYSVPYAMPIPNFVVMRSLAQTLAQRAQCDLLLNEPDRALHELTLVHDVCRVLQKPPTGKGQTLVEAMINVAITGLYEAMIAQGLQKHQWQEPQLATLQQQLGDINLPSHVFEAFREMPAHAARSAEILPLRQWYSVNGGKPNWTTKSTLLWLMPHGWVYQNIVAAVQLDAQSSDGFDPASGTFSPHTFDATIHNGEITLGQHSPYHVLANITFPNYAKAWQTTAYNQTMVNEAQIACALERCYLAHGEYPDSLDALVPTYLTTIPQDIIGGQPLHYRRTNDGKYLLYSVGWNEKDDGGKESPRNRVGVSNFTTGDWVWPVTAK